MEKNKLQDWLYEFLKGEKPIGNEIYQDDTADNESVMFALRQLDEISKKSSRPNEKRMWENIHQHVVASRRKLFIRRWSLVAAVLMPAVFAIGLFLHFQSSQPVTKSEGTVIARNQVQLFLNNGQVVRVQQIEKDSVLNEEGAGIRVDSNQSIIYTAKGLEKTELVYNTLIVPRCCEYHLVLADGTQVWMNSDSELRFPVDFVGNERRVFLKGEAYFQVAKDAEKPFRVETGKLQIEALGTGFDVNAYQQNNRLLATLVEGRVKVSDLSSKQRCILVPGEQACLEEGLLTTKEVNVNDVIGWKEGRFVFNNVTMEEIAYQLERWYDVKINFQDVIVKYYRFTGVMKRYNQLDQLIEFIQETTDVKFQVNGKDVRISRR